VAEVKQPEQHVRIQVTDGLLIPGKGEKTLFSSWRIAFFGALVLLVALPLFAPDPYWTILKFFPDGILVTFEVTVASIFLATVIGLLAGLGQISRNPVVSRLATVYVEVIRGIPLLVQIFFIYFALGKFLHLQGFVAAVISMAFCYGAYMGEIFLFWPSPT
jgi:polar amino acid transport system permease protein